MKQGALVAIFVVFLFPTMAQAQGAPPAEIYLGFPLLFRETSSQLFGAHGTFTVSPRGWLGVSGDVGVHVGEVFAEKSIWTILGGPVFSAGSRTRFRAFGHTLFGLANSGCGRFDNGCRSETVVSSAFGGGIDIRPRGRVAFRVQSDGLMTRFGGRHQNFLRLSFGIVLPLIPRSQGH